MIGYRQSNYDPDAYQAMGRPVRPFNWVQWTGVGLEVVGLGLFLLALAGRLGWVPQAADVPSISGIMLMLVGMSIINSRREPSVDVTPEQRAANRRLLIITIAICAAILGLAVALDYLGA